MTLYYLTLDSQGNAFCYPCYPKFLHYVAFSVSVIRNRPCFNKKIDFWKSDRLVFITFYSRAIYYPCY